MLNFLFKKKTRQEKLIALLEISAERLRLCAESISSLESERFWRLAGKVERLAVHIVEDPRDAAHLRRFISYYLGKIVDICEASAPLIERHPKSEKLAPILQRLSDYEALLISAEQICLENDFNEINAAIAALDQQLERLTL